MKKVIGRVLLGFFIMTAGLVVYILWDNNRIMVVEQTILIDDLPRELEGFTIVQVTDLHEKEFGKNQRRLVNAINRVDYNAVVFTGDMLDGTESTNYQPFYVILQGLVNKKNVWFIPGNADPESYHVSTTVRKSDFIQGMEEQGAKLLESIDTVTIDKASVHFVNFELSLVDDSQNLHAANGVVRTSYAGDQQYLAYRKQLWEGMPDLNASNKEDVVIALNHYPVVDQRIDQIEETPGLAFRNYDLILAGHYHGGQIRLPFFGALFVPEPWYEKGGLLPPQDRINGLWEYNQTKQYVSTGLGSSDAISFLKFRFNNPPQIDVLTLRSKQ